MWGYGDGGLDCTFAIGFGAAVDKVRSFAEEVLWDLDELLDGVGHGWFVCGSASSFRCVSRGVSRCGASASAGLVPIEGEGWIEQMLHKLAPAIERCVCWSEGHVDSAPYRPTTPHCIARLWATLSRRRASGTKGVILAKVTKHH